MDDKSEIAASVAARGSEILEELRGLVIEFGNDYRIAKVGGISQPTIQRFAVGEKPATDTVFKLMAFFGGQIKYKGAPVEGGRTRRAGRRKRVTPRKKTARK